MKKPRKIAKPKLKDPDQYKITTRVKVERFYYISAKSRLDATEQAKTILSDAGRRYTYGKDLSPETVSSHKITHPGTVDQEEVEDVENLAKLLFLDDQKTGARPFTSKWDTLACYERQSYRYQAAQAFDRVAMVATITKKKIHGKG